MYLKKNDCGNKFRVTHFGVQRQRTRVCMGQDRLVLLRRRIRCCEDSSYNSSRKIRLPCNTLAWRAEREASRLLPTLRKGCKHQKCSLPHRLHCSLCNLSQREQEQALAAVLAGILWAAGAAQKAIVCWLSSVEDTGTLDSPSDNFIERVSVLQPLCCQLECAHGHGSTAPSDDLN